MFKNWMRSRLGLDGNQDGAGLMANRSTPAPSIPTPATWDQPNMPFVGGGVPSWMKGPPMDNRGITPSIPQAGPIGFQPRPQGGILPMEIPFDPRQRPYEPRPLPGGESWDPRQRGYEPRPQNPTEQPNMGGYYDPNKGTQFNNTGVVPPHRFNPFAF